MMASSPWEEAFSLAILPYPPRLETSHEQEWPDLTENTSLNLDTLCAHAGQRPDPTTGSVSVPIYQTSAFVFRDCEHAANLFNLKEKGNIYTRIMNPTTEVFEQRMAALEGGVAALATASGQAAVFGAITAICSCGDEIVSTQHLYGGTFTLFDSTLRRLGIHVKFVDGQNPQAVGRALTPKTRAVFIETIGNPRLAVPDISEIARVAHDAGIPLIVDNTFASPYLCRPIEHGADIVVHSATKYIDGHGTSIAGVIVDSGRFNWANGRFPELVEPDPIYHGTSFWETFGNQAYIAKARLQVLRDTGACLSPFNAFLLLNGVETLALRMRRHSENAMRIAEFLESHPAVEWVAYPGLKSHPWHENARRYLRHGFGGMIAFGIKGGRRAGQTFADSLRLFSLVANVGDVRSLVIHPASTTQSQLTGEQQRASGVTEDLVRLSIGIEDVDDLIADLEQALERAVRAAAD